MAGQPEHNNDAEVTLKLAEEQIALTKQKIVDEHVRVTRSTNEHDEVISTLLNRKIWIRIAMMKCQQWR